MLTTHPSSFEVTIQDSTVAVSGGAAKIGSSLYSFSGSSMPYGLMTRLGDGTSGWQNALLYVYLSDSSSTVDMTQALGSIASTRMTAPVPAMVSSNDFPVGLFMFNSDGTTVALDSYRTVG